MRMLLLAPLGAFTACGDAGDFLDQEGSYGSTAKPYEEEGTDNDSEEEEDLTGGFATCEEALKAEGEDPTVFTDDYSVFTIYLKEAWANERPWLVTFYFREDGTPVLTCGEMRGESASTRVNEETAEEYWNCAYAFGHLSIYDPESDSGCNEGYEDYAYQGSEYFVKESPGVFVRAEDDQDTDED